MDATASPNDSAETEHVSPTRTESTDAARQVVVPIVAEQLTLDKRVRQTGKVLLHVHTEEHVETVEAPLLHIHHSVERVPLNLVVETVPPVRQEGDTTIYPVLEERLIVRKELVLLEEIRVTRRETGTVETSSHVLRREQFTEERLPAEA